MKRNISLLAAGAIAIAPAIAAAAPPSGAGAAMQRSTTTTSAPTTSPPGNGQTNGAGYWHQNSGQAKGQPNQSCETTGTTPGNSGSAPGSAFSGGTADSKYAGSQPQNSRNTASVSQYDVACANQPK